VALNDISRPEQTLNGSVVIYVKTIRLTAVNSPGELVRYADLVLEYFEWSRVVLAFVATGR